MGRLVVVTGATGGIGGAVVRHLLSRGDTAVAVARPGRALADLAAQDGVVPLALDLSRPFEPPAKLLELDRVDGLVHCAAIAEVARIAGTPVALWQETLMVNVVAAAELTRVLLPALRIASGHVLLVNAAPGVRAIPGWSAYCASKAALRELADCLRLEESPHGVKVASVYPPGTATNLLRTVRGRFGRPYDPAQCLQPEVVARRIVDLLEVVDHTVLTEVIIARSKD